MEIICKYWDVCRYSFVEVSLDVLNKRGMFEASMEFLNRKQVDLISSFVIATPERLAVMDFTYPVAMSDYVIVQPMPKIQRDMLTASFEPMQSTVN